MPQHFKRKAQLCLCFECSVARLGRGTSQVRPWGHVRDNSGAGKLGAIV